MNQVRFNVLANLAGQGWAVALALLCTPFYIKLLGTEAYGLIAFFFLLQSLLQLFDLGIGATLNREIARSVAAHTVETGTLVVSAEAWYWALGLIFGVVLLAALPSFAVWWLNPRALAEAEVAKAARVFAALALLQWPSAFYGAGLAGLQKQTTANFIQMPFIATGAIGGLAFIWFGPRSVAALLGWQACTSFLQLLVLRRYFWSSMGLQRSQQVRDFAMLWKHWRFSLGVAGISIFGLVLTHLDKVILSRLLYLEAFAHYSLANTLARGLYVIITPVFSAYFPRLSTLVARNDMNELRQSYHTGNQLMAALLVPLAAVIAVFPTEIATLWLRDAPLAKEIALVAPFLVLGVALNGLMNIPFALQLAFGRTRIALWITIGLVVALVPGIILGAMLYGTQGAAFMWFALNILYVVIGAPLTHRLLPGEMIRWLLRDLMPAVLASLIVVVAAWFALAPTSGIRVFLTLGVAWGLATSLAFLFARDLRVWMFGLIR
jgi:O-antigen/teichoic acid export membrane protein